MHNDTEGHVDLEALPRSEIHHLLIERTAKRTLWLVIALAVVLIVPYLR